jgi:hypothetical protein
MMIGPRHLVSEFRIPNGTRFQSRVRVINGTEYQFTRIGHVDGSVTLMAEAIGWDQPASHLWTVTPDGRVL